MGTFAAAAFWLVGSLIGGSSRASAWPLEAVIVTTTIRCGNSRAQLIEYRAGAKIARAPDLRISGGSNEHVALALPPGARDVDLWCTRDTGGSTAVDVSYWVSGELDSRNILFSVPAAQHRKPAGTSRKSFSAAHTQYVLRRGQVKAFIDEQEFEFREGPLDSADVHVTIVRDGVVHNVTPPASGVGIIFARLVPIDASGEPVLLISMNTGGNGCCGELSAYTFNRSAGVYRLLHTAFGCKANGEPEQADNGGMVLVTTAADGDLLGGNPARCVGPLVTLAIREGKFVNTSLENPEMIHAAARAALHEAVSPLRQYSAEQRPEITLVELGAYLEARCRLGECADGWRTVRAYDARFRSADVIRKMNLLLRYRPESYDGMDRF